MYTKTTDNFWCVFYDFTLNEYYRSTWHVQLCDCRTWPSYARVGSRRSQHRSGDVGGDVWRRFHVSEQLFIYSSNVNRENANWFVKASWLKARTEYMTITADWKNMYEENRGRETSMLDCSEKFLTIVRSWLMLLFSVKSGK